MSLAHFFQDVGVQLQELFGYDAPGKVLWEEIDRLDRQIRTNSAGLAEQLNAIDDLRRTVRDHERQAASLASHIEVFHHVGDRGKAWELALELDRVREAAVSERRQLDRLRQHYQRQQAHHEVLEGRLAKLEKQAYAKG